MDDIIQKSKPSWIQRAEQVEVLLVPETSTTSTWAHQSLHQSPCSWSPYSNICRRITGCHSQLLGKSSIPDMRMATTKCWLHPNSHVHPKSNLPTTKHVTTSHNAYVANNTHNIQITTAQKFQKFYNVPANQKAVGMHTGSMANNTMFTRFPQPSMSSQSIRILNSTTSCKVQCYWHAQCLMANNTMFHHISAAHSSFKIHNVSEPV